MLVTQSCLTLCDPRDYNPPGAFVHGILQARIMDRVAIPFSKWSSQPRDQTLVSCTAGEFFTVWATREVHFIVQSQLKSLTLEYGTLKRKSCNESSTDDKCYSRIITTSLLLFLDSSRGCVLYVFLSVFWVQFWTSKKWSSVFLSFLLTNSKERQKGKEKGYIMQSNSLESLKNMN